MGMRAVKGEAQNEKKPMNNRKITEILGAKKGVAGREERG